MERSDDKVERFGAIFILAFFTMVYCWMGPDVVEFGLERLVESWSDSSRSLEWFLVELLWMMLVLTLPATLFLMWFAYFKQQYGRSLLFMMLPLGSSVVLFTLFCILVKTSLH